MSNDKVAATMQGSRRNGKNTIRAYAIGHAHGKGHEIPDLQDWSCAQRWFDRVLESASESTGEHVWDKLQDDPYQSPHHRETEMNLTKSAHKVAATLSGIKIVLICSAVLTGLVLIVVGMAATDGYGDSAPSTPLILFGLATLLSAVWVYALFGFLEYVVRLLTALVEQNQADDFEEFVATTPTETGSLRTP